jgi:anti-sigma regulatory factor (Ser/Thr protein kinase)
MSTALPDVRLTMSARPEGVAVVRQALAGMADALEVDAAVLADMRMAVSEACTNVVVHAYDDGEDGVLEVDMAAGETALTILVRDHGTGLSRGGGGGGAERRRETPALGLGLPLIAALSDAFELRGTSGHGTEVRMTFNYERERDPAEQNPVTGTIGDDGRWDPDAAPAPSSSNNP